MISNDFPVIAERLKAALSRLVGMLEMIEGKELTDKSRLCSCIGYVKGISAALGHYLPDEEGVSAP